MGPPRAGEDLVGTLLGIARHERSRGPIELLDAAEIGLLTGVEGDRHGARKPGHNRRQVTAIAATAWRTALAELGADVPWHERRVNLLLDGLVLEDCAGARLVFAGGVEMMVTGWCDPCRRMEAVAVGLERALMPGWRSGINMQVATAGRLRVGEQVRMIW